MFTVDINSKVGSLIGNYPFDFSIRLYCFLIFLLNIEDPTKLKLMFYIDKMEGSDEISSYHILKFIYPMGRIRNLSLDDTFANQSIPSGAKLVLIGKKDFFWDSAKKGRDITVSYSKFTLLAVQ